MKAFALWGALLALAGTGQASFMQQAHHPHHKQHHAGSALAVKQQHQKKAEEKYHPLKELCPFGYGANCGGGGTGGLSSATKSQVANILKGIISNLSHKKGLTQISAGLLKDYGLHQAKNLEVKKALLGLMVAFGKDKKATTEVVAKLTGADRKNLSSLAAVSRVLVKIAPLQDPIKNSPRTKGQPLKSDL